MKKQKVFQLFLLSMMLTLVLPAFSSQDDCYGQIPSTAPNSRFVINNDGTVSDVATKLMWKQCAEGMITDGANGCAKANASFTWQNALQRSSVVNSGGADLNSGYSDWRLPNIKELESIVERKCVNPAVNLRVFPSFQGAGYWSSTVYATPSSGIWFVSFGSGSLLTASATVAFSVILVRDQ